MSSSSQLATDNLSQALTRSGRAYGVWQRWRRARQEMKAGSQDPEQFPSGPWTAGLCTLCTGDTSGGWVRLLSLILVIFRL